MREHQQPLRMRDARRRRRRTSALAVMAVVGAAATHDGGSAAVPPASAPEAVRQQGGSPVPAWLAAHGGLRAAGIELEPGTALAADLDSILERLHGGEHDQAAALAERWRAREPGAALPYTLLGIVEVERFRLEAAARLFRAALRRAPGDPLASDQLATLQFRTGALAEAAATYARSLALHPDHAALLVRAARVDAVRGRVSEAAAKLRRAIAQDFVMAEAYRRLAALYLEAGVTGRALDTALEGLSRIPGDAELSGIVAELRARESRAVREAPER